MGYRKHRLLFDTLDSDHHYYRVISKKNKKDEKGEYIERRIEKDDYCSCHPETCCHFDGMRRVIVIEKDYLK